MQGRTGPGQGRVATSSRLLIAAHFRLPGTCDPQEWALDTPTRIPPQAVVDLINGACVGGTGQGQKVVVQSHLVARDICMTKIFQFGNA